MKLQQDRPEVSMKKSGLQLPRCGSKEEYDLVEGFLKVGKATMTKERENRHV